MKNWVPALGLTGIGFFIAGCIIGGIWGGNWLDVRLNTSPVFLIIGIVSGIAFAVLGVYKMLKPFINSILKGEKDS